MSTEQGKQQIRVSPDGDRRRRRFFRLNEIIAEQTSRNQSLISILQAVQEEYRYLPEEVLTYIATALDLSPATVFGVATFFAQFSLKPKGRYLVTVCDGTACHVKRSMSIYDAICRKYDLKEGDSTTSDMLFTLETVACVGCCALAPVMTINGQVHAHMSPDAAVTIIDTLASRKES
ncbi:NAD(P)H-dependent oxidoreductase subunit E [Candidatus Acetothermia bacterium]|nr:NAD(P)H-dependent oxidoreductase subunit E [Candidatus Acetothermia bacterium]